MAQKIAEKKDYIIKRLIADFQKVYFGRKLDGTVVDLPEMTYFEVANRMVQLMYIESSPDHKRWISPDFMIRVYEFGLRTEERFMNKQQNKKQITSSLPTMSLSETDPYALDPHCLPSNLSTILSPTLMLRRCRLFHSIV